MIRTFNEGRVTVSRIFNEGRVYNGVLYTEGDTFFKDIRHIEPRDENGVFVNVDEIFSVLCDLELSSTCMWFIEPELPDDMIVDGWLLNGDEVFHTHPELGIIFDPMETGLLIAEVLYNKCVLCGDEIKGEYDMIHKFYKL